MCEQVLLHEQVESELSNLPRTDRETIKDKILDIISRGAENCNCEKVQNIPNSVFRFRVGNYRVFFLSHKKRPVILKVKQRKNAYDSLEMVTKRAEEFDPSQIEVNASVEV